MLVPDDETGWTMIVPLGAVMMTVICLTLVFVLGTDTSTTIGVMPGANRMMTDALG